MSLELQRLWNVEKKTEINYVRNLAGGGVVAAHGHCVCVLQARGTGTGCRGLMIYDFEMLQVSDLPVLAHDTNIL